mmetsp:Transcript_24348/g.46215  ORF Transcript_24348/g.46215 Transcript_24348/m.46215 type:complete len:223 (-) Transcript_24348:618-1286(-)
MVGSASIVNESLKTVSMASHSTDNNKTDCWPHKHLAKCIACGRKGATLQCKFQQEGASAWQSRCSFCGKDDASIYCPKCKYPDIVYCCLDHAREDEAHHKDRCELQQLLNLAAGQVKKEDFKTAAKTLHQIMKAAVHKNLRWIEAEAVRSLAHVKLQMLDREKAMKYVKEALVISKELGDNRGQAYCYMTMALAYNPTSPKDHKAMHFADKAIEIANEVAKV